MTKFKKVLLSGMGACILLVFSLAQAQVAPGPDDNAPRVHPGQRIQQIYSQLNLTDDQKKQLEANKKQHRAQMENAHQALKAQKDALKEALMKPGLDMPRIYGIHNQIKAIMSQMEDEKLSSILAVRAILTPEQFLKLGNLMHRHKEEHGE